MNPPKPKPGQTVLTYNTDLQPCLPNVQDLQNKIIELLEFLNNDFMKKMKKEKSVAGYEQYIEYKFPDFTARYYGMYKMLISGKDPSMLWKMLESIEAVQQGKTSLEKVEKNLGNDLKDRYITPVLNKKKKKNKKKYNK